MSYATPNFDVFYENDPHHIQTRQEEDLDTDFPMDEYYRKHSSEMYFKILYSIYNRDC